MYTIWVLALSLGLVTADIGITSGYHYKVPETSYGVPSYQTAGSGYNTALSSGNTGSAGFGSTQGTGIGSGNTIGFASSVGSSNTAFASSTGSNTQGTGSGYNYNTQGNTGGSGYNYNTQGNTGGSGYNHNQGSGSGFNYNGFATGTHQGAYQGSFGSQNTQSTGNNYYQTSGVSSQPSGAYNHYQTSNQYHSSHQSSADQKYQEYYNQIVHQPPQIFKHFYIHAAPEEPEVPKPRQPIVLPPPQKHYKVIFIKTPVQPAAAPQFIPIQQQNEEKTIVYVLVKKPEDAQDIVLPKIEQKPPTKPEVFFIKYSNKHDQQAVINNIVNDYNKNDVSTSFSGLGGYTGVQETGTSSGSSGVVGSSSSGFGSTSGFGSNSEFGSTSGNSAISEGSFSASSSSENSYGGTSGAENQASSSFGSQYTSGPTVTTAGSDSSSFGTGLETIFGTPGTSVSSSTASSESSGYEASAISTSQGVPHESYGVPKFKEY